MDPRQPHQTLAEQRVKAHLALADCIDEIAQAKQKIMELYESNNHKFEKNELVSSLTQAETIILKIYKEYLKLFNGPNATTVQKGDPYSKKALRDYQLPSKA